MSENFHDVSVPKRLGFLNSEKLIDLSVSQSFLHFLVDWLTFFHFDQVIF